MEMTKVGIREFRTDLAEYIASSTPVAVTRHGQTVGYFIPTHGQVEADVVALKKASKTLDKLLEAQGVDVESVVADFKTARRRASTPAKKLIAKAA
jgi:antitoxin (DNA-binding transcriptional repressor) of toxin-antitoxin stability system